MAQENTVDDVPLPEARPVSTSTPPVPPAATPAPTEPLDIALPRARPDPARPAAPDVKALPDDPEPDAAAPAKPLRLYQSACPALLAGTLQGEMLPPISDGQCGARSPLLITGVLVNGRMMPLSGGVTTSCGVASALPAWIGAIDGYVFAKDNTRVAEVLMGTSYMCRNVNNASSGNLSFHAFAEALDVSGFKLEDGRTVLVETGWGDALSPEGRLLRFAHDAACAQFSTMLGPEANAEHADHLHLDMGCHGKTCTARLCQ